MSQPPLKTRQLILDLEYALPLRFELSDDVGKSRPHPTPCYSVLVLRDELDQGLHSLFRVAFGPDHYLLALLGSQGHDLHGALGVDLSCLWSPLSRLRAAWPSWRIAPLAGRETPLRVLP